MLELTENLKTKTIKGTIWSSLERFSVQGILFIVMIIMARILTPDDYGLVGMLTIFMAISQSIVDSGFSQALIRKQDRSEIDNSTVFYFNVGASIILYFLLYIFAPLISEFYNEPQLILLTRIIGLTLIINSFGIVQRALLSIKLDFKTQAKATLTGAVMSGIVGIFMAYKGYGVWAIVCQQISALLINTGLLWIFTKWKPILAYSWQSFRDLFSFGSKMLISGLLETIYKNLYLIIIGKVYTTSDLGYYTRAQQFTDFASSNITGIFQRVTYPVLCTIQNDDYRLSEVYRKILKTTAFIIFPLMMGLAAVAKPMVVSLLTEKWLFSSILIQILCFAQMWYPVHAINLNLLQVKGRSDLFLRLEILKKIIGVAVLCVTISFGLEIMCWGMLVNSIISLILNTHYTGKLIHLGFLQQMKDLLPILLLSLFVGVVVFLTVNSLPLNSWITLTIGVVEGILLYILLSRLFRFSEYKELIAILQRK